MINKFRRARKSRKGFTLIELLVVVLIIGILAAIAVPQYFKVVEKGRAAEAMAYLGVLKGAQERYLLKKGGYYAGPINAATTFDITMPAMKYFNSAGGAATAVTTILAGNGWAVQLTRTAPAGSSIPTAYGAYTFTYNSTLGNPLSCSVPACTTDLMP